MAKAEDIQREKELIEEYRRGDQNARRELHKRMESVVESTVRKYGMMTGLSMDALRVDAHRLIDGYLLTYTPSGGATPATWVRSNLEKKIMNTVRESQVVKAPEKINIKIPHYTAAHEALVQQLDHDPTDREIHHHIVNVLGKTNVTLKDVSRIRDFRRSTTPASLKVGDGGENSMSVGDMVFSREQNVVSPVEQFKENQLKVLIKQEVDRLPFKDRDIIKHYYEMDGYPKMSLRALAVKYGVSKNTIDRLIEDIEGKLRTRIGGGLF